MSTQILSHRLYRYFHTGYTDSFTQATQILSHRLYRYSHTGYIDSFT